MTVEAPAAPARTTVGLERMKTGIAGLDHLLEGGLVRGNSVLLEGPPGCGKSTLAVRIIHEGIVQYDEPGLIVTFEEFPRQLYQESLQFGVDLREHERNGKLRVVWTPPARILEGFRGKNDLLEKIVDELGVRRMIIDSITHFRRVVTSELELREVLATVLCNLKLKQINPFMIKEQERLDEKTLAFEEYLVDSSLRLYDLTSSGGGDNGRFISVRKTRGQGHVSGLHPFSFGRLGVAVHPRLRPQDVVRAFHGRDPQPRERVSLGVEGLDRMLHGGFWSSTTNLVAGEPGTGKSVVALHFLDEGLRTGETAFLVSVKSTPDEILSQASSLGMDWGDAFDSGQLRILHVHPSDLCVEKLQNDLLHAMQAATPDRLVFDSVDDLWDAVKDDDRYRDHVLLFTAMFNAAGSTSILMNEGRARGQGGPSQQFGYLASCVIQLGFVDDGNFQRQVGVRKFSGSDHFKEYRPYDIDSEGMHVTV